jgi:hypothetical protein
MKTWMWFLFPILAFNLSPLLGGGAQVGAMWTDGGSVLAFFSHPWVHVSRYHALIDISAFLGLWGLISWSLRKKAGLWMAANAGSLLGAILSGAAEVGSFGGLSGISHGLLAVVALEMMRQREPRLIRTAGTLTLVALFGKCGMEVYTGDVVFSSLHLGSVGTPLVGCHLGGALAASGYWLIGEGFHCLKSKTEAGSEGMDAALRSCVPCPGSELALR